MVLVKGTPGDVVTGSLAAHPAALASRGLFVAIASVAVLSYSRGRRYYFPMGIISGLALYNSIEFGLPILLGMLAIHLTDLQNHTVKKSFVRIVTFLILAAVSFVLTLFAMSIGRVLNGEGFEWPSFTAISSQFAAGFGAVAQPGFGLHVIFLGLLASCAAIGDRMKRSLSFSKRDAAAQANMLVFIGVCGYFSFPYFVNRSIYSGQLQYFLIFLPIAIAALIGANWMNLLVLARQRHLMGFVISAPSLILLLACFSVSSVMQIPSWNGELTRLGYRDKPQSAGFNEDFTTQPREVIAATTDELSPLTWADVSHVVQWGNYVAAVTGSPSKNISSDPENYWLLTEFGFPDFSAQQCSEVADTAAYLVFEKFLWDDGTPMCEGFRILRKLSPTLFLVQKNHT
jgi:hypothetical protein